MATEHARALRAMRVALLCALLAACATAPRKPLPEPVPAAPPDFPAAFYLREAAQLGRVYRIQPEESELVVVVRRSGKLAHLGHNHVVSSRGLSGFVLAAPAPEGSRFDFFFPVASLVVDDPALRAAEGADFSSKPTFADIEGTRANMLGEKLLDAAQFPWILVAGRQRGGNATAPELELQLEVRGVTHVLPAATRLSYEGNALRAEGELTLSHADLGLVPFSVLGGALGVAPEFLVRYRISARAERL